MTASQLPVLRLASKGLTISETAEALNVTEAVVAERRKKMCQVNKCRNLTHLVAKALRNGVIQ